MRVILVCLYLMISLRNFSQVPENEFEQAAEYEEAIEDASILEKLEHYRKHRLDLNEADENDLASLHLIDPLLIHSFMTYRKLLGKLHSIYELQAIPGWNVEMIRNILPYITIDEPKDHVSLKKIVFSGDHSIIGRLSFSGDKDGSLYNGNMARILFRYRYHFKDVLQYGLLGEKDAGESFFGSGQSMGFDFWSFHLFIKKFGSVKALALGDYVVNMGQGLIHWQGFAVRFGIEGIKRQSPLIKPYQSSAESNFMRGMAVTIGKKSIDVTALISYKRISANTAFDPARNETVITSIDNSGYHRTTTELLRKNIAVQFTTGMNVSYKKEALRVGWNAVYHSFSHPLMKQDILANLFSINGRHWWNQSIDMSYTIRNIHLFAEAAMDMRSAFAFIGGAMISLHHKADVGLLYKNLGPAYQSINGAAHTKNTLPSNEKGTNVTFSLRPATKWRLNLNVETAVHPWLKYTIDAPSMASSYRFQLEHAYSRQLQLIYSFRKENTPMNRSENGSSYVSLKEKTASRFQVNYKWSAALSVRSRVEWNHIEYTDGEQFSGFLANMDCIWEPLMKPMAIDGRVQFFGTEDHESRIYTYERDVLYQHSVPAFSGYGWRYYINIKYALNKQVGLWFRTAVTRSGERVEGAKNMRAEVRFQARVNF